MTIITMIKKQPIIFMSLIAFMVLSFILQKDFYTSKFGSIGIGIFFLVLLEFAKINFEIKFFQKLEYQSDFRQILSKSLIFLFCAVMIGFSFYATFKTISKYNQNSLNDAIKKRQAAINYNETIKDRRSILVNQLSTLKKQLATNQKLLSSYSNDPANYWRVKLKPIQKENTSLSTKIAKVNKELLRLSDTKPLFIPEIDSHTEKMNLVVMLFLAGFLDLGIIFLCWQFNKPQKSQLSETKEVERKVNGHRPIVNNGYKSKDDVVDFSKIMSADNFFNKKEAKQDLSGQDIKKIRTLKGMTQKELGEIIGISQKNVSRLENGELHPEKSWIKKMASINML